MQPDDLAEGVDPIGQECGINPGRQEAFVHGCKDSVWTGTLQYFPVACQLKSSSEARKDRQFIRYFE